MEEIVLFTRIIDTIGFMTGFFFLFIYHGPVTRLFRMTDAFIGAV